MGPRASELVGAGILVLILVGLVLLLVAAATGGPATVPSALVA
jgi:hypothetical protein